MSSDKCIHPWAHPLQSRTFQHHNKFPCACCSPTPFCTPSPGQPLLCFLSHRLDFLWRISYKGSHALSLLYHFISSPAINVSVGCFTLAPISLVRLIKFNPSSECPEVSLCGVVLLCFGYIEHAFVFKVFPLKKAFSCFISLDERERQGVSRQYMSGC